MLALTLEREGTPKKVVALLRRSGTPKRLEFTDSFLRARIEASDEWRP